LNLASANLNFLEAPHSKNLRKGRHSSSGHVYAVTFVTEGREPWFTDLWRARIMIQCMMRATNVQTLCFVVMPDHVHWMFQLLEGAKLSRVVHRVKSASALGVNASVKRSGRFWQPGFHDHAIRNADSLREIARYVVANPVRAGLVHRLGLYPHWDAKWL
jgi:REP element-mobilizing transposase RayT